VAQKGAWEMTKQRVDKAHYRCHFGRTGKETRGCRTCPRKMPFIPKSPYCYACFQNLPEDMQYVVLRAFRRPPSKIAQALAERIYAKADTILLGL